MVIANDTPYSGLHTNMLHLKHATATNLVLTVLFDGEALAMLIISKECMLVSKQNSM
jgi:hypothetical protein